ncbi:hypothetical protein [Picosynechococcus sp. NKBG15041c]|nr:hypothetical protein [Picosynechococcus sp. NKBG15041c]
MGVTEAVLARHGRYGEQSLLNGVAVARAKGGDRQESRLLPIFGFGKL